MEKSEKMSSIVRAVLAVIGTIAFGYADPINDNGFAVFLYPLIAVAIYVWLGVAFFFAEMIWKLIARPQERLFASIMLGSTVMITVALLAAYWLIKDSIGVGATIMYAIAAYIIFAIVRWFRRHTASYYAALEAEKGAGSPAADGHN